MKRLALILVLVLLFSNVLSATTTFYIDPDAPGPTHDGTSWNDAYTSMFDFEAAEEGVLSEPMVVNCRASSGTPDTSYVNFSGWTTSAVNYLSIIGDGTYKMVITDSGVISVIQIRLQYMRIEGLWLEHASTSDHTSVLRYNYQNDGANDVRVISCVIKGPGTDSDSIIGIRVEDDAGDDTIIRISNTLIYNIGTGTDDFALKLREFDTAYIYNCTIIGGEVGISDTDAQEVAGNIIMKNTVINGSTTCAVITDAVITGSTNNIFSDGTGFGANITANTTLTYTGATYHLDATDTAAIDAGVDLSSDGNIAVTDDFDGDARPQGADFDIGYDELVQAGGSIVILRRRRE